MKNYPPNYLLYTKLKLLRKEIGSWFARPHWIKSTIFLRWKYWVLFVIFWILYEIGITLFLSQSSRQKLRTKYKEPSNDYRDQMVFLIRGVGVNFWFHISCSWFIIIQPMIDDGDFIDSNRLKISLRKQLNERNTEKNGKECKLKLLKKVNWCDSDNIRVFFTFLKKKDYQS
jgi:hypothetical protein